MYQVVRGNQYCPNTDARKITREEHQDARDIRQTEQYAVSSRLRKKVEMLFAHLERILGLGRLRLRGPSMRREREIPPRRHPPEPPETGKDLSRTAVSAKSPMGNARAHLAAVNFGARERVFFHRVGGLRTLAGTPKPKIGNRQKAHFPD